MHVFYRDENITKMFYLSYHKDLHFQLQNLSAKAS